MDTLNNLLKARTLRGLSRKELAQAIGVTPSAILKAETVDPYALGFATYVRLAQLWQVPLRDIVPADYKILTLMESLPE